MQHVAASGPTLIDYERDQTSHPTVVTSIIWSRLQQQLLLAPFCMRAPGFPAAAAAEAAPPAQLAAYLDAAVKAIHWLGSSGDPGGCLWLVVRCACTCTGAGQSSAACLPLCDAFACSWKHCISICHLRCPLQPSSVS